MIYGTQQNLPAALAAVPWLLACSALRAKDRGQSTSGTLVLCFAARRFGHIYGSSKRGFLNEIAEIVRRAINVR